MSKETQYVSKETYKVRKEAYRKPHTCKHIHTHKHAQAHLAQTLRTQQHMRIPSHISHVRTESGDKVLVARIESVPRGVITLLRSHLLLVLFCYYDIGVLIVFSDICMYVCMYVF